MCVTVKTIHNLVFKKSHNAAKIYNWFTYIKYDNMYTVYIKSNNQLVNVDLIESIKWNDKNEIYINNGKSEETPEIYKIYAGKAINGERAVIKILSLIREAKNVSSEKRTAVILDFTRDIDSYEAYMTDRVSLRYQTI